MQHVGAYDAQFVGLALGWLNGDGGRRIAFCDDLTVIWQSDSFGRCGVVSKLMAIADGHLCPDERITDIFDQLRQQRDGGHIYLASPEIEGVVAIFRGFRPPGMAQTICLDVWLNDENSTLCDTLVSQMFQLTPAEMRMLSLMIAGRPAPQISVEARISIETVRSHIRSIYAKTNVSSREELFGLMGHYRRR